jgi:hypothetical protein
MSGSRLAKTPLCAAAVLSIVSVAAVGCGKSGTATQNSALTNKAQVTVTQTVTAPAPSKLTHAQEIAAADTICETSARKVAPQIAKMAAIQKSNASQHEIHLAIALPLEAIAGGTRGAARLVQELEGRVSSTDGQQVLAIASTMVELAVLEEQLSQAFGADDRAQIAINAKDVRGIRAHARELAHAFGYHFCGLKGLAHIG